MPDDTIIGLAGAEEATRTVLVFWLPILPLASSDVLLGMVGCVLRREEVEKDGYADGDMGKRWEKDGRKQQLERN